MVIAVPCAALYARMATAVALLPSLLTFLHEGVDLAVTQRVRPVSSAIGQHNLLHNMSPREAPHCLSPSLLTPGHSGES
jgi:hypothetical protein